ncbi:uncharacterized protein SEPMUDRAFT_120312 [Sphaerulina musiva SO2202]|uniref:Uncharacterized protein n=1 Tax=Sphaerulina musiva (strain SO2202) TaxID=692275 RepID=N1QFZ2_SPHMS|nr:uncharacterized protein SEPMUDRAFT_120312 [Sphaerulina musiva SO2202]EMF09458.1 hypothetical protein SEPMUDRAFT_120312 [Sphaerulina musiva SO2202]
MVNFITIATALLGVASIADACKQNDCCYAANGGCPSDVYNDCWSKCCGTTKVWEMRKQRNNSWKNVNVYPGVPCAE